MLSAARPAKASRASSSASSAPGKILDDESIRVLGRACAGEAQPAVQAVQGDPGVQRQLVAHGARQRAEAPHIMGDRPRPLIIPDQTQ